MSLEVLCSISAGACSGDVMDTGFCLGMAGSGTPLQGEICSQDT